MSMTSCSAVTQPLTVQKALLKVIEEPRSLAHWSPARSAFGLKQLATPHTAHERVRPTSAPTAARCRKARAFLTSLVQPQALARGPLEGS